LTSTNEQSITECEASSIVVTATSVGRGGCNTPDSLDQCMWCMQMSDVPRSATTVS